MQCVRLWWHAECSGAQCTHSARKHGGRLRAGPSFLAKVDLLIGRWPGWEGGTHLCSRCSPCCPSSAAISVAHCYLVERRWPASGAQLLRSSTTEVLSLEGQRCWCGFCRALAKVGAGGRVGLRWSLQTSKDEEEGAAAWHPPLLPLLPLTCYKRVKMEKSWAREQQQMEALSPARAAFRKLFPMLPPSMRAHKDVTTLEKFSNSPIGHLSGASSTRFHFCNQISSRVSADK